MVKSFGSSCYVGARERLEVGRISESGEHLCCAMFVGDVRAVMKPQRCLHMLLLLLLYTAILLHRPAPGAY